MFYIDIDLKSGAIFIFPFEQDESYRYLISVETKYKADQLLRKLNASLINPPPKGKDFKLEGEVTFANINFKKYMLTAH
jgi:hypothetical protein